MRTSFHHQPEAQHPNFQLSTRWQADYPIFRGRSGHSRTCGFDFFLPSLHSPPECIERKTLLEVRGFDQRLDQGARVPGLRGAKLRREGSSLE